MRRVGGSSFSRKSDCSKRLCARSDIRFNELRPTVLLSMCLGTHAPLQGDGAEGVGVRATVWGYLAGQAILLAATAAVTMTVAPRMVAQVVVSLTTSIKASAPEVRAPPRPPAHAPGLFCPWGGLEFFFRKWLAVEFVGEIAASVACSDP